MKHSRPYLTGIWLMTQASVGFALMALCTKFASQNLPSLEVVFFRSVIGSLMIYAMIRKNKASVFGTTSRWLMVLRGVTGFIALSLHFYTIEHLPLGTAVMLNYTGPIFTAILAVLFLKEKLSPLLAGMILLSFVGVYLLVGADFRSLDMTMVLLGLLSAVFVGIVYVVIRAIHDKESPFTIIFYFTLVSTIGSIFYLPFGFKWPNAWEWVLLLGVGIGSFYGQWLFTLSLRYAPASLVSPFAYLTPLLSFGFGFVFFGEKLTQLSALGAALIVLSGSLISYFETRQKGESV
jgi:drug/metabolite transporter (DMT)-like permease